jgi:hypothetical protein
MTEPTSGAPALPGRIKSGYAKDVAPHLVEDVERQGQAIPAADQFGRQEGNPGKPKVAAKVPAVSLHEAELNMKLRREGKMPPLEQYEDGRMETADGPSDIPMPKAEAEPETLVDPQLVIPAGAAGVPELLRQLKAVLQSPVQVKPTSQTNPEYMDRRMRVTLDMEGGTYVVPAVDVKVSRYAVMVALPLGPNDVSFTPKPGSEVNVRFGDKAIDCYYPGTAVDWPELKLSIIVFVRKTEG